MPLDEVVRSAISRLGVVRVSNSLNPLLYMTLVVVPASWGCAWLFRDDPFLRYGLVAFGALFPVAFLAHYTRFSMIDPDRLQSEEYLARKQELSIIERKGQAGPEIVHLPKDEMPMREQDLTELSGQGDEG